jgi:nitrate reductase gamma subunit
VAAPGVRAVGQRIACSDLEWQALMWWFGRRLERGGDRYDAIGFAVGLVVFIALAVALGVFAHGVRAMASVAVLGFALMNTTSFILRRTVGPKKRRSTDESDAGRAPRDRPPEAGASSTGPPSASDGPAR